MPSDVRHTLLRKPALAGPNRLSGLTRPAFAKDPMLAFVKFLGTRFSSITGPPRGTKPIQMRISHFSLLCYHVKTLYLFIASDIKTTVVPTASFGIIGAVSMSLRQDPLPFEVVIPRVPLVLIWIWINLLLFNVSNQRQPAGIAEDSVNKPWRPLPALRLSHAQAKRLNWALYPVVVLTTLVIGGTRASICLMILGYLYNETGAGDVFYARNFLNAAGYLSFVLGAVEVVTSFHDGTFSIAGQQWFALIFAVIASTGHMQDIPDQAGDEARGRRTLPLAIGDWNARISIAVLVPAWSLIAVAFWGTGFLGSVPTAFLGGMLACRVLSGKASDQNGDKISFLIWNAWVVSLYLLPILQ
jgi:4-hydroxybenzoate polyprenyltransferase